ncbi:MATE family efflux transporter [Altericroceibacterium endophyticum]|uniref:MATE family efflux transporter n=1 Tax=Altericroceibacterium endophyticum TaxID=1808508 RepID=A0A6I4T6J1_9SPHN|nr:MATE family efflux transporter [Altericroceibacterium endophyticum]MXO66536.1 MATE family efflux transporter [Altericroceibacterium endophyticum]
MSSQPPSDTGLHPSENTAESHDTNHVPDLSGDLTNGPIFKTLIYFSVPTLLSNSLQSLNGTVNSIWVGRLIGEEALAATANANIIMFLVSASAFGFGMAGTVKIGQRYGARNLDGARRTFGTAVGFCFLLSLVVGLIGWLAAPALLDALGTPGAARDLALGYLRMVFVAMPMVMVTVILSMGLRGAGDSRTPLIFMGLTVLLDVIFNPMLIIGLGPLPELGIVGSALSMVIANILSLIAMVAYVYYKDLPLRLRGAELAYLKPTREELRFIIAKGVPMGGQMLIMSAAGIIVVGLVNREGMLMTAAYGAAMQLFTYIQMPAMAIGGAVSAMAAQYIGARKWDALDHVTRAGVLVNLGMTGALTILLLLFDRPALGLFLGPDSPAVPLARHIQLLASWNFILFGVTMVLTATMRAGGAVTIPLIILAIALYPVRLGFYYLTYDWLGSDAIWISFPVAALAALLLAWWFYRRPGWRQKAIAESEEEAREQSNTDGDPAGRFAPSV